MSSRRASPFLDAAFSCLGTTTGSICTTMSATPSKAFWRAARVRRGPAPTAAELRTVADIVRRLDGMPLAIELAAGRLSTFSLADLHRRLDRSLDLLGH